MAWAYGSRLASANNAANVSRSTDTLTVGSVQAVGSLVIVAVGYGQAAVTATTITDTRGNTWVRVDAAAGTGTFPAACEVWASVLTTALQVNDTIVIHYNATITPVGARIADSFTGGPSSVLKDVSNTANSAGANSSTVAVTTTRASDLVYGAVFTTQQSATAANPAGWTGLANVGASGRMMMAAYQLNAAAASYTYNPTFGTTSGHGYGTVIAGFKLTAPASLIADPRRVQRNSLLRQ